jgi:succinoglycan biosynthesis protein ExoA
MPMSVHHPQTGSNTAVSIIVVCRNEKDFIEDCLRSILSQDCLPSDTELIVADGMSTDGTRDILTRISREDGRLKVIDNPRRFVAGGLNSALAVARGRIILRMDAHTVYATDYVQQCLAVLLETGADNVGGPALTGGEAYMQRVISAAYHSSFAVGGARFHDPFYEGYVDTVPYGCWPREVFERIGLFDEELIRNQDDEFNLRLTRSGGRIWQSPRIKSWYHPRGCLTDLFRQYRQYGYWKVRVIQKHKLPASVRHVVPAGFLLSLVTLPLVSLWWSPALWGFLVLVALYLMCNVGASLITASKNSWTLLPVLPLVFATYHFSYGLGFVRGIWDFLVVRQGPHPSLVSLSRGPIAR